MVVLVLGYTLSILACESRNFCRTVVNEFLCTQHQLILFYIRVYHAQQTKMCYCAMHYIKKSGYYIRVIKEPMPSVFC